jgi:hypothetical protein
MMTFVVGKRRNTTPWFSAVGEKTARAATANCTTATANRTNRDRKLYLPRPQTVQTATANRTNRDRTPHEPQPNRSVNLFLGSTVCEGAYINLVNSSIATEPTIMYSVLEWFKVS